MSDPEVRAADEVPGLQHRLLLFLWLQLWLTLMPGAVCASPLIFMRLAEATPALGIVALVAMIPALVSSVYFIPALMLVRTFFVYEPQTLNGGSLLPLPAYSVADWVMLLTAQAVIVGGIWLAWQGMMGGLWWLHRRLP